MILKTSLVNLSAPNSTVQQLNILSSGRSEKPLELVFLTGFLGGGVFGKLNTRHKQRRKLLGINLKGPVT